MEAGWEGTGGSGGLGIHKKDDGSVARMTAVVVGRRRILWEKWTVLEDGRRWGRERKKPRSSDLSTLPLLTLVFLLT